LSRQNIAGKQIDPVLGYVFWRDPSHPMAMKNGIVQEHRAVMAEIIGRPLLPAEEVHHKNGVRSDNTPRNLELWTSPHPSGQRPAELVAWARIILATYPDDLLAKLAANDEANGPPYGGLSIERIIHARPKQPRKSASGDCARRFVQQQHARR
jgi:hypothetical protein